MTDRVFVTERGPPRDCAPEVALTTTAEGVDRRARPERGGTEAFEAIYDEHADFLYATLRRLGLDPTQAEDALQDVFVVVHRKLPTFEGRGTLRSWLYGVTLRVARRHHRRRGLRRRFFELFGRAEAMESVPDARPDPEAALETADGIRRLDRLLDELRPERREILVLVEVSGFSVPEAAECLGLKLNTAYSRLRLARRDLAAAHARERARETRRER
ncbi:MAG TPA: sigma-70 family RNA polymerase sigma factor [Sandaracinaceae bacterium LLY-WYZ-13_1]|nr:sigma-70 family RNA polymerase sigma factor [Sandaracinaceae bacterium LLY-WYZ-13_1]